MLLKIGNHNEASSGKWRHCASKNVGVSEETLALTSNLIGRRVRKCVIFSLTGVIFPYYLIPLITYSFCPLF